MNRRCRRSRAKRTWRRASSSWRRRSGDSRSRRAFGQRVRGGGSLACVTLMCALPLPQVLELKAKAEAIEKREGEKRAQKEAKHAEEVAYLKKTNAQLKKELEAFLAPTKK